jgi:hypothetical protein
LLYKIVCLTHMRSFKREAGNYLLIDKKTVITLYKFCGAQVFRTLSMPSGKQGRCCGRWHEEVMLNGSLYGFIRIKYGLCTALVRVIYHYATAFTTLRPGDG